MNKEEAIELIISSLFELIKNDKYLLEWKLKEECINHKLASYINSILPYYCHEDQRYDVDIEYDKNYADLKEARMPDGTRRYIRPDIIVHNRGTNLENLIAIEVKKHYCGQRDSDKAAGRG